VTTPITVIVNPASGGGRCGRIWPAVVARLHAAGISFTAVLTERAGDGTRLARAALRAGATTIVAVGGDGTANEVLNGFFADGTPINPAAQFALIPAGTGNDLAAALGVRDTNAVAALGAESVTRHVDLLRVHFTGTDGEPTCRYAMQGLFVGIVAEGAGVPIPGWAKWFGRGAYLSAGALAVLRHRPCRITVRLDDAPAQTLTVNGGIVANAPRIGGGLPIAPAARMDDGRADVILLRAVSRIALLTRLMPRLQRGTHLAHPLVAHTTAHRVSTSADGGLLLAIDGEVVGRGSADVVILPGALRVALPQDALHTLHSP
jgi:diacylglycerol kinase (ATP)